MGMAELGVGVLGIVVLELPFLIWLRWRAHRAEPEGGLVGGAYRLGLRQRPLY
jgi:hypothetical protein